MSNAIPPEDRDSIEQEARQTDTDDLVFDPQSQTQVNFSAPIYSRSQFNSETSQPVVEASKEAAFDVWSVFQLIWQDPANGLQTAITSLGDSRAFNAGIALCVLFILAFWMAALKVIASLTAWLSFVNLLGTSFNQQLSIFEHIRILISASIPVLGMIAVLWCIRQIFKGAGNYKQFIFVTGFSLAPITLFLLLLCLLGTSGGELIFLVSIFCWTTVVLFLNTALIGVLRLSSRNALLLVPILFVSDFFITRIGFDILY